MQCIVWQEWAAFLKHWGLKPLAVVMMEHARPLFPLAAQMMLLGTPLFRGVRFGAHYDALIEMLGDEDCIASFSEYLQEGKA